MMSWLVSMAQGAAWTLICAYAARGFVNRRFWIVLIAGYAFNLMGVAEGMVRQRDQHRARTSIEARP
jgi:hypothetical protein